MNGAFKYTLTDDQRSTLRDRLTGKKSKAKATRAEVSTFLQACIDDALAGYNQKLAPPTAGATEPMDFSEPAVEDLQVDFDDESECAKQNRLLITRINRLQHRLDQEFAK